MPKKSSIVIIGAGEIGKAIAHLLEKAHRSRVQLWDMTPGKVVDQKPLDQIIPSADAVFFCVPSWALKSAMEPVLPLLSRTTIVTCVSKGIESTTKKTINAFLTTVLHEEQTRALLLGPMLAEEIVRDLGAAAVIATKDKKTFRFFTRAFAGSGLRLAFTNDVAGAALASVLKNAYSLAMGISAGLGWGANRQGWLAARAIQEMAEILKDFGAKKTTVYSEAGIADFLATGYSNCSLNRETGREIVEMHLTGKSEGTVSLPLLVEQLGEKAGDYPLLRVLERVCLKRESAQEVFEEYFNK
jgi:glycerol-3-phosphate dehydrogenase (NAD(P)+)